MEWDVRYVPFKCMALYNNGPLFNKANGIRPQSHDLYLERLAQNALLRWRFRSVQGLPYNAVVMRVVELQCDPHIFERSFRC